MKNRFPIAVAIAGLIAIAAITPSCKPDEKPCDTALQDSLNIREIRLKEREMALREREMAIMERERALGISNSSGGSYSGSASTGSATASTSDSRPTTKNGLKNYSNDPKSAAYKPPVLAFPGQYPESSERMLAEKDVEHLTPWGMKVMLNEIYARNGYIFTDADLKKHFARESWYKGTEKNLRKIKLTPTERENIAFIQKQQQEAMKR